MFRSTALLLVPLALASTGAAQRLVGLDIFGLVHEFPSPLGGACLGPSDPVFTFPTAGTLGACTLPVSVAGTILGDIGVDTLSDTYWVTDGFAVAEYTAGGVPIAAYNGPMGALASSGLTGLGVDTSGGLIWATDGVLCQSFTKPPSGSGCLATIAPAGPAFPCSLNGLPVTDVEWDPVTGELWFAEALQVHSFLPTGTPGSFGLWTIQGCGPGFTDIQGLGVDTAGMVTGSPLPLLYATDRFSVAYDQVLFGPAPPTAKVYPTSVCFTPPGPLNGLSYTARPNHYGTPSWCVAGVTPTLSALGQSVVGNASFGFQVNGMLPGSFPFIYYSASPLCPSFNFILSSGCAISLWISPLFPPPLVMPPANASGTSTLNIPFLPGFLGLCRYFQALVVGGGLQTTDALEVIGTLP